jgi:hypothetical protein
VSVDIFGGRSVRLWFGADVGRRRCILDKTQEVAAVRRGRMKLKCERQMGNLVSEVPFFARKLLQFLLGLLSLQTSAVDIFQEQNAARREIVEESVKAVI